MLGDAAPDYQRPRPLRGEHDVREVPLIPELVNTEVLVLLPERPQLVPDRPVRDGRHDDGNFIPRAPVQDRTLVSHAAAEFPEELLRGPRLPLLVHVPQPGLELRLENDPVRLVRYEDVPEPVQSEAVERDVVHFELAVVIVPPRTREVVVHGPARCEDDVDELALDESP